MQAPPRVDVIHETTDSTDFTDASNKCGASVADEIFRDQDTPANLEQVSKINSTNQNICCYMVTNHGAFSNR